MRKRDQNGADFKDIEILSEKFVREVAEMDGRAVDALYSEIRFPDDPAARVRDLAADAARQYRERGEAIPEHVEAALDAPAGKVDVPAIIQPLSAIEVRESALVPVRELYSYGRQRALMSGGAKVTPKEEESLAAYASALARQQRADIYDPERNHHDRLREEQYRYNSHRLQKLQMIAVEQMARVRKYEEELAEVNAHMAGGVPHVPAVMTWCTLALLTLTMVPALHDLVFFRLAFGAVAWAASVIGGLLIGTIITWAVRAQSQACVSGRFERWSLVGIASAMCLGVSFMRAPHDPAAYLFTTRVAVIEIGAILVLEAAAWRSRAFAEDWRSLRRARVSVSARLQMAHRELAEREMELQELRTRVDQHIRYVESRWVRHSRIEEIEEMAVKAVRDGYLTGIAENRGRLMGAAGAAESSRGKHSKSTGSKSPRLSRK